VSFWEVVFFWTLIFLAGRGAIIGDRMYWKYREKRFLKHLRIRFPDAKDIVLSSVETTDHKALYQIKEQLDADHL